MAAKIQLLGAAIVLCAASVQSVVVTSVTGTASNTARGQATLGNFLESKFVQAAGILLETVADSEMGSDIGTDIGVEAARGRNSEDPGGPRTLAEYCSAPTDSEKHAAIGEGDKVMANWRGYGTFYPGTVERKRGSGRVDIHYDDGFHEKRLTPGEIKDIPDSDKKESEKPAEPRDDPACELQGIVESLKKKFGKLSDKMSQWLQAQRARVAKGKAPDPPPTMKKEVLKPEIIEPKEVAIAGAPSPAAAVPVPSPDKLEKLEKLKIQLADRDEYIKQLEKKAAENEAALQKQYEKVAAPPAPAAKTVDDLIAEYYAKIAQRDEAIERLKRKIQQQEEELSRLGAHQISLQEIEADVAALAEESKKVSAKRTELEKRDKLDDELRVIVDNIVKAIAKMEQRVARLLELEQQAKERKAEAEREAEEAERAARLAAAEKAEMEGKSKEETEREVEQAVQVVRQKAEDENREADLETLNAAQEVEADLKDAEKQTGQLDTELHPHGSKWWRYRYEHSFIEAVIMVFIVVLYLIWNVLTRWLKDVFNEWSVPAGSPKKTKAEEIAEETHGAMQMLWLQCLAEQAMVCILVFLTVWTIAQTPLLGVVPQLITPSKDMRVPTNGEEYKRLALDICTIFFFAIMFFYTLMLSVAHETRLTTMELEDFDRKATTRDSTMDNQFTSRSVASSATSRAVICIQADQWDHWTTHFKVHMAAEMQNVSSPEYVEIQRLLGGDLQKFPLWYYLSLNVRATVVDLFTLSWKLWLPVVVVFMVLCCLHRFAHMGYIRIMSFFGVCLLGLILAMYYRISSAGKAIQDGTTPVDKKERTIHNKINTEGVWMVTLQFSMFFICYGVARTICQPWMWELHFWPVTCLTILAFVCAILFVLFVAPAIPTFCAVMALPPYVSPTNIMMMRHVAKEVSEGRHCNPTPR